MRTLNMSRLNYNLRNILGFMIHGTDLDGDQFTDYRLVLLDEFRYVDLYITRYPASMRVRLWFLPPFTLPELEYPEPLPKVNSFNF